MGRISMGDKKQLAEAKVKGERQVFWAGPLLRYRYVAAVGNSAKSL